jgi:nicotinate-nucleotide adenylyltransferase
VTVLATASNPHFEASRIEMDRSGPSYTVDTMRAFREALGAEARLYFITGADAIIETVTWRRPEEIAALCEFVAVTRPGYALDPLTEAELAPGTRIHVLHMPGLEISSTEIRRRVAAQESIRYLVPPPVARYIETNRLYALRAGIRAAAGPSK